MSLTIGNLIRSRSWSCRYTNVRQSSRSNSRFRHSGLCYYHRHFSSKAIKCTRRCTFQTTNMETGKRQCQSVAAASLPENTTSCLPYVMDNSTKLWFLIDKGVKICLIPHVIKEHRNKSSPTLQAANGIRISTFGQRSISVDLGLRRNLRWIFTLAGVKIPIIGAEFLTHFHLSVNIHIR